MGIFMEEVFYNTTRELVKENVDIASLIRENQELVEDNDELLSEMVDILNESIFDDFNIKKEDLLNPTKLEAILKRFKRERYQRTGGETFLNVVMFFILNTVGCLPGMVVASIPVPGAIVVAQCINIVTRWILPIRSITVSGRVRTLIKRLDKAEKKVTKALNRSDLDSKTKKGFQEQLSAIKKAKQRLDKAQYEVS